MRNVWYYDKRHFEMRCFMDKKRSGWVRIGIVASVLVLFGSVTFYIYQRSSGVKESTVYVQSVSSVTAMGSVGMYGQYNGIVEAKDVIEVNPSGNMAVKECFVTTGSEVNEGDPLFCYDVEDMELQLAQMQIDITGVENNLRTYRDRLATLKKDLGKAKEEERYEIELSIQTVELDIRKAEYDLEDKKNKAADMQKLINESVVYSPVTGTVRSVQSNSNASDPYGYNTGSSAYITIIAGTAFCVKGTVDEQAIYTLYVGMPVLIRSRVNSAVYHGTIYRIDTDSPEKDQGGMIYYYDGDRASKYAFYVEPDSIDGLLIGQHVLIDLNTDTSESDALMLPAAFLIEENDSYYVWAVNGNGRIEKRKVMVSMYSEETECYKIVKGLDFTDRIAFPDETIRSGMLATETMPAEPVDDGGTDIPVDTIDDLWNTQDDGMNGIWDMQDDGMNDTWDMQDDDAIPDDTVIYGG